MIYIVALSLVAATRSPKSQHPTQTDQHRRDQQRRSTALDKAKSNADDDAERDKKAKQRRSRTTARSDVEDAASKQIDDDERQGSRRRSPRTCQHFVAG